MKPLMIATSVATITVASLASAQDSEDWTYASGLFVHSTYSILDRPIFRPPGGNGRQIPVRLSKSTFGFAGGFESIGEQFGYGLGVSYWSVTIPDFRYDAWEGTGSPTPSFVDFAQPTFKLLLVDLYLHLLPWERGMLDLFVHLGMGSRMNAYTITQAESPFEDWVGSHSISEFEFSYGVGLRLQPVGFLSVFAEYRLAPGDLDESSGGDTETVIYWSGGGTSSSSPSGGFSNFTKIFSAGLKFTIGL